jgi:hypothetical protein
MKIVKYQTSTIIYQILLIKIKVDFQKKSIFLKYKKLLKMRRISKKCS